MLWAGAAAVVLLAGCAHAGAVPERSDAITAAAVERAPSAGGQVDDGWKVLLDEPVSSAVPDAHVLPLDDAALNELAECVAEAPQAMAGTLTTEEMERCSQLLQDAQRDNGAAPAAPPSPRFRCSLEAAVWAQFLASGADRLVRMHSGDEVVLQGMSRAASNGPELAIAADELLALWRARGGGCEAAGDQP